MYKHNHDTQDFSSMSLKLASPDRILEWSYGEVTKPETINYRTQRSEKHGLFDERIFGPEKDFECYCGKYKGIRYKGIVCEKCGVEITRSIVRRERMGHISLASPVAHIWFLKNIPSRMALVLNVTAGDLEKVVYFAGYIVTEVDSDERNKVLKSLESEYKTKVKGVQDEKTKEKLKEVYTATKREIASIQPYAIFDEVTYNKYVVKYGTMFEAEIGAEAVYSLFKKLDLKKLAQEVEKELAESTLVDKKKIKKRLSLVRSMVNANIRPEWMFLTAIPVIPAALRPMVALEGGRHATSDLNDLYRRVINRNNRLKKLMEINAPNVILRNEKRILQEAVDALIDNQMRQGSTSTATAVSEAQRRPLKSLSDNLKGKQGLFRANLLGKRVDYSGRSVIVVGPTLALNECGLPKHMALELFRPFVISKLIQREYAHNIRGAGRLIEDATPEVWGILEEVIENKYVLLNRAPTLHRLGIQAFKPILIEGNAIQIHPLVVQAFNADFDGDQMAVHVPLSEEAQAEAREIIASNKNLLRPGSGSPIISLGHQDIILGAYWSTRIVPGEKGEGGVYGNPRDAILAYDFGALSIRARIMVQPATEEKYAIFNGERFETSVGRLLFNERLPDDYPYLNKEITKGEMSSIINDVMKRYSNDQIMAILDELKSFGFTYATKSGTTFGLSDVHVPENKQDLIAEAIKKVDGVNKQYEEGLLSREERYRLHIEIWHGLRTDMEKAVSNALDENSSIYTMWKSGARGQLGQITNMAGLKGLIAGSRGRTLDFPILSSSKEGLTPIEYFVTTNGSRKGLGDTALNTAQSGYLTRKLFSVAQEVVVTEDDCETKHGVCMQNENLGGIEVTLSKGITGRYLAKDVEHNGTVIAKRGTYVTKELGKTIESSGVSEVWVRSPMTCDTLQGVCQKCYGQDLGTGEPVALGEAVGTVAAQSIGEPATQLTMRTFHAGGTAAIGGDIVTGLPRVQEVFECRPPRNAAVIAEVSGTIKEVIDTGEEKKITIIPDVEHVKTQATSDGKKTEVVDCPVHFRRIFLVKPGDVVTKGQLLTDGSADLSQLFKNAGKEKTQEYVIAEISKIYELQGASVARKHLEIIVKQMFSRVQVKDPGATSLQQGDIVEYAEVLRLNRLAKADKKEEATVRPMIMGITNVALSRGSFLSAASFQHTNKILIEGAVRGKNDRLTGLKENVIIGRLIPAGTGFEGSPKWNIIHAEREEMLKAEDTE